MKYLVIPLLIFNFLFLALCDDSKEDIMDTVIKETAKIDNLDRLVNHEKKDSIYASAIVLKK